MSTIAGSSAPLRTTSAQLARLGWSPETCVLLLIMISTLLRLAGACAVGLGNGESYYFSCARHLDLGYFDQPPLYAWVGHVSMWLAGGPGPLALRVPMMLMFAGTTWLMFVIGRRLYGPWPGFYAALMLNLAPVFTVSVASFFQPDSPLMLAWMLCVWCLVRICFDPQLRRPLAWWALAGLFLGFALLSKYHTIFLVAGTGLFVLTRKDQRHWLKTPGPYLAGIIALVCFIPVLVWNARHDWISFLWQGNRGAEFEGLRWDWLIRSLVGQSLWLLPWIWLAMMGLLLAGLRRGPADARGWFITCLAAGPVVFFTVIALYAPLGFHFHWQAPGYLLLFLPLGERIDRRIRERAAGSWWGRHRLQVEVVVTIVVLTGLTLHVRNGWFLRLLPRELPAWVARLGPAKWSEQAARAKDPTLEALDLKPLEGFLAAHGLLRPDEFFLCGTDWFYTGKLDYALGGRMDVCCLNPLGPRSFAFFDAQERWLGRDAILVTLTQDKNSFVAAEVSPYFGGCEEVGTVPVYRGDRLGRLLTVFRMRDLRKPMPFPYGPRRPAPATGTQLAKGS